MTEGTNEALLCSFNAIGCFVSGCMIDTKLLVVPKSIPIIISSFCKLPVAILIPIFAIQSIPLLKCNEINYFRIAKITNKAGG